MSESIHNSSAHFEDPFEVFLRAMMKIYSRWVTAVYPFASIGQNLSIHYTSRLSRRLAPRIKLGNSVTISKDVWLNIPEAHGELNIVIDDSCRICPQSVISAKNYIHLEEGVILSSSALIMDHNHEFEDINRSIMDQGITEGGRIRIGRGSFIGHGVAILCNRGELVLGPHCVVVANAVVTRSFPAYSVISGNPAVVIEQIDPAKRVSVMGSGRTIEADPANEEHQGKASIRTSS